MERWGNSLANTRLSLFLRQFIKTEKTTLFECFVRLAEKCEFVERVITLSLPGELEMARLLSSFFASIDFA